MKPLLVVNFKTYENGTGKKALKLAKIIDSVAEKEKDVDIIVAVQHTDIRMIADEVSLPVFAQHIDGISYGSNTGYVLPEAVKDAGAVGTLINHSEHQLKIVEIEKAVERAKDVGLRTIVCATDPKISESVAALEPEFVAVEPPELIGSKMSVSQAKPEIIENSIAYVNRVNANIPVLCGAGIHTKKDAEKAIVLGSVGVLVASGIVKASNVKKAVSDLVSGLKEGVKIANSTEQYMYYKVKEE